MKKTVISYSLTGNNDLLASSIASGISADHIRVTEEGVRNMGKIAFDMLFGRTPKVNLSSGIDNLGEDDFVIFVGPVWMGVTASPFRFCYKNLKKKISRYAFVSISGGADGPNPKLESELTKRMGRKPVQVIDLHIADLLPSDPRPTREDTSSFRLTGNDAHSLAGQIANSLNIPG